MHLLLFGAAEIGDSTSGSTVRSCTGRQATGRRSPLVHERSTALTAHCRRVRWKRALSAAHHAGRLQGELVKLGRCPLIMIDEAGYIPFEAEAAYLFSS